ncbi:toxin-antitoxin system, toxin component [Streptomyces sp. NPDC048491]|uniref:toxin-antitoxin system, toxin component n=1 Tax=Streptomyces sp. NPDC048491 TaxID=3157207 RepID=UPI00344164C3
MRTAPKAMRRLSARLVGHIQPPTSDEEVPLSIGRALSQVRGRPVRLRKTAFPPATASGLWVDRSSHDLIVYEENTEPEHQLVIIGHEAWHMFQGHGSSTDHGATASRAGQNEGAGTPAELVALLSEAVDADLPLDVPMDIALHFAARADDSERHEEVEAELFGFRFATDVQAALARARAPLDPHKPARRIEASMAHRFDQYR